MELSKNKVGGAAKRWLASAYAWTLLCGVVVFTIPVTSDNVTHFTRTGVSIPPVRQTLFEHSHGLVIEVGVLAMVVLVTATAELRWRLHRHRLGRGVATTVVGSCVLAFSIFGFVFGVLSLGSIGLLGLLSGASITPARERAIDVPS